MSASLWGCELKWWKFLNSLMLIRQPPCEAVSWNTEHLTYPTRNAVSLLVRLWVEMIFAWYKADLSVVSLLVRLWVEITQATVMYGAQDSQPPCEAVSWNTLPPFHYHYHPCQPPCEAVSWNMEKVRGYTADRIVSLLVRLWVEIFLRKENAK